MRRLALFALAIGLLLPVLASAPAHAQATRTWVSGVGNDGDPCSRTAPCKTFATAITRTAAGGEINCLDPGGYGELTITKSIMISCDAGTPGVLVTNTGGITVSAGASDTVTLRGLDINGLGGAAGQQGTSGVFVTSGKSVTIEDCRIDGFRIGVGLVSPGPSFLTIINSTLSNNGLPSGGAPNGGAVQLAPGPGGYGVVAMTGVRIVRNYVGIGGSTTGTLIGEITNSIISNNSGDAISVSGGVTLRIGQSVISGNGGRATSGSVLSYGNNQINGNNPDTVPTTTALR